jgi:hypothetical protein
MFAGHIGVALAIGRLERRVNVGVFVASALLLDVVLWLFILLGWESVRIPTDFTATHQPDFVFPYSHGLVAAVGWSVLAGAVVHLVYTHRKVVPALLVAAAVFSHWLLDALVHRPEMPLMGDTSAKLGLALWNHMPVALTVEAAIVALGLSLFLPGSGLTRRKSLALAALSLAMLVFTAIGMTVAPAPPSALAMAGSSWITLVVVCGLFAWLGRRSS